MASAKWPQHRKESILLIVSLSAAIVGAYGPMLSPGFVEIASNLSITVEVLAQSTAWLIFTLAIVLFLTNPLAKLIGRRPIFILAIIVMFATSIWGAAVKEYNSFLASRIVAALGMAPYEVLVQCTIGDLYFVHERATRIAVWNLFLLTGISGGALIAGYIIEREGYQWTFGVCAVLFGVLMVLVVLFVPETAYRRDGVVLMPVEENSGDEEREGKVGDENGAVGDGEHAEVRMKLGREHDLRHVQGGEEAMHTSYPVGNGGQVEKKHTFVQSLRVFTGRYSYAPIWKLFVRPMILLFYPAVLFGFLIYGEGCSRTIVSIRFVLHVTNRTLGTTLTWIVVFSVVNAVIFTQPPYNFSVSETGLISLSPFIMTAIGELISGPLNDWICIYLTKKNRGIYEPEFRLPLMLVAVILGVVGFYGFGAAVEYQTHWSGPVLCFGFANMSLVFASTCVFGYVVDSYRTLNEEAFVAINARNLLTFGLTYFVNDWLAAQGPLVVFCILGSLFLAVCLLTIPLW